MTALCVYYYAKNMNGEVKYFIKRNSQIEHIWLDSNGKQVSTEQAATLDSVITDDDMITASVFLNAQNAPAKLANLSYLCVDGRQSILNLIDLSALETTSMYYFASNDTVSTSYDISEVHHTDAITYAGAFRQCSSLTNIIMPSTPVKIKNAYNMFFGCSSLTSLDDIVNLSNLDFSTCTDNRGLFSGSGLTSFDFSLFNFDRGGAYNQNMLNNCLSLQKVWINKEHLLKPGSWNYSVFSGTNGTGVVPTLHVYTDATSQQDQIDAGKWSAFTLCYANGLSIPDAQVHYGSTKAQYESA